MSKQVLCLLAYDGSARSGRVTADQVIEALDNPGGDRLGWLSIEDDGPVTRPLSDVELVAQRETVTQLQSAQLLAVLDHALATCRGLQGMRGVSTWSTIVNVDLAEAPYAEDLVRDFAERNQLFVTDSPYPSKPGRWSRTCAVNLTERSWSPTIVQLNWPSVVLTADEMVARDADLDGKHDEAQAIRNAEAF